MQLNTIADRIQHEARVVRGEETKDLLYSSQQTFADQASAEAAFRRSIDKLLHVNGWSALSAFTADFALYDPAGVPKPEGPPQTGDSIRVTLPGPMPENWVRVTQVASDENRVEFTVQPSHDPRENQSDQVVHFFHEEARSTFRVERTGNTLTAYEIGRHEGINNQEPQAGNRSVINTVIAEGGWLFYQKIQWKLLTDYLVHLTD